MSHFPTKAIRQKFNPTRQIAAMRDVTVLLVGLTLEDVERFHAAQVPYMGQRQDELAFISTTFDHLLAALTAMGWADVEIHEDQMHQKVVRRRVMSETKAGNCSRCDDGRTVCICTEAPVLSPSALAEGRRLMEALENPDWMQVVLNQGPPCFHVDDDGRVCFRAKRWAGHHDDPPHGLLHPFVSIHSVVSALLSAAERLRQVEGEKETLICAAIQMSDGYIVRGHRHVDCFHTLDGIKRYDAEKIAPKQQGFITSRNRFVDREEGLALFLAAGGELKCGGTPLTSEELY